MYFDDYTFALFTWNLLFIIIIFHAVGLRDKIWNASSTSDLYKQMHSLWIHGCVYKLGKKSMFQT